jgi:uncharacterized membrane protein YecN with MAPEG domain
MPLPITGLYAAPLALLFIALSIRVIGARRRHRIGLGTGHPAVERAARAQANCAEYAPFGVILLGLLEGLGLPAVALHGLGLALLAGRAAHGFGISRAPEDFRFRVTGMALTFTMLGLAAVALLGLAVLRLAG